MPDVYLSRDAVGLAAQAHDWLVEQICQHQSNSLELFSLALAGGSTPRLLYERLAQSPASKAIDWSRVLFFWGDERNVPANHVDSNYRMACESLLDSIPVEPANVVNIPNSGGDASEAAMEYEKLLRQRLPISTSGVAAIDCVLLGMGDDVHTASLFPETTALAESESWVVANFVPKLATWRITLTAPLINAAKRVAFLIAGSGKTMALHTLWHGPHDPQRYPAQLIRPSEGALIYFVDRQALGEVKIPPAFGLSSERT